MNKILAIIGIILWTVLGGIVYYLYLLNNKEAVLVWASTVGILVILGLSIFNKREISEEGECMKQ